MLKTESMSLNAPAIANRILTFHNNSTLPPYIIIENLGVNTVSMEYQESQDGGSTWTTIVGTSQNFGPGTANGQIVVSSKPLIALQASGNVAVLVHLGRQYNGFTQPLI